MKTFSYHDFQAAAERWGANCGPWALAVACGIHISEVPRHMPDFAARGWTNPGMMERALASAADGFELKRPMRHGDMFDKSKPCVVRIQWEGPWLDDGVNPKWAYTKTHWVATWCVLATDATFEVVSDCNTGMQWLSDWEKLIVPMVKNGIPRATGGWAPTHVYKVTERVRR